MAINMERSHGMGEHLASYGGVGDRRLDEIKRLDAHRMMRVAGVFREQLARAKEIIERHGVASVRLHLELLRRMDLSGEEVLAVMRTMSTAREHVISELHDRIALLKGGAARDAGCLPFGVAEIDNRLPGGGLAYGALHEFAGGGSGTVDDAAAALLVAGIAARTKGKIVWCSARPDLFFPSLA
jgi:hypothetical protein